MGILTEDMQRVVNEQRLGYIATVCPDGTPNLSPKGTTAVWDDDHLIFADICSPNTVANLLQNPALEINVVDTTLRKGYRFKGTATILGDGPQFEEMLALYRQRGTASPIQHIVLVKVERALPLISPAYGLGQTEAQVSSRWERYWDDLRQRRAAKTNEP
ncbi:MAG TPA: pyridoxamine 5'-phosphate oxidase family protein [Ktedonobacterales bacterium]|nr:pyridoxamine 5'-phosphate oxidase family protein [Ktedonobacterales bacterium]